MELTFQGAELLDIENTTFGVQLAILDGKTLKIVELTQIYTWKSTTWRGGGYLSISTPEILIEQTYKEEEYDDHFNDMLPAFKDPRYIKIDNKPIFIIYDPKAFDARRFMDRWQELAANNGIGRIYFMGFSSGVTGSETHKILEMGFDAVVTGNNLRAEAKIRGSFGYLVRKAINRMCFGMMLDKYKYQDIIKNYFTEDDHLECVFPAVIPGWDRSGIVRKASERGRKNRIRKEIGRA